MFTKLEISSAFVALEFRAARDAVPRVKPDAVTFAVSSSDGLSSARWTPAAAAPAKGMDSSERPYFVEDTQYRLHVRSLISGVLPNLSHPDPLMFAEMDALRETGTLSGIINFRRQVGQCLLRFSVGDHWLELKAEVFPSKIDYATDYKSLLYDVGSFSRGLAIEYIRSTFHRGSVEAIEGRSATIEWLVLLRAELQSLSSALEYINLHPHRHLVRDADYRSIERIKKSDSTTRRSLRVGAGRGQFVEISGVGKVRERVLTGISAESIDTPEHRWLKGELRRISQRLAEIHEQLGQGIQSFEDGQKPIPKRLAQEEAEVAEVINRLDRLCQLPVLEAASNFQQPNFSSLTLLSGVGYSEAYRSILILKLGLNTDDGDFAFSVGDLHYLYEVWCFTSVVHSILRLCGSDISVSDLVTTEERGIRVRLKSGNRASIKDTVRGRLVEVSYNLSFDGATGGQKPDITISFKEPGKRELIVVLDAKYRVDQTPEFASRFGMIGPPIDAVNALHRYRDAITLKFENDLLLRPVVKGVALFPATSGECTTLADSELFKSLDTLGVGALPYLPGNTEHVDRWLGEILALDYASLGNHGPKFTAQAN